ncbi:MAG: methyltransferase domain-containing protein [Myxococcales bacterium]
MSAQSWTAGEGPELHYEVERRALGKYAEKFVPLAADAGTQAWLAEVAARPHSMVETWLVSQLTRFMSAYDAHGLTATYAMHLLSEAQWGSLTGGARRALLDVGAGAGYVTEHAKPWFQHITCTETSRPLAKRLGERGFRVHAHDLLEVPLPEHGPFDVISCLNVLDRTRRPISLLAALRAMLAPGARLVLALPLPVRPHVHVAGATVSPQERLPISEDSFKLSLVEMSAFLEEQGFDIERIARVPYLSRGDSKAPYYVLDDALWVLSKRD